MLALLAEMARNETETLRERINSGLAEARRKGVKLGRPSGTSLSRDHFLRKHKDIVRLLKADHSIRNTAKIVAKGASTAQWGEVGNGRVAALYIYGPPLPGHGPRCRRPGVIFSASDQARLVGSLMEQQQLRRHAAKHIEIAFFRKQPGLPIHPRLHIVDLRGAF